MDHNEHRELSEQMRELGHSVPRTYVERGINRHESARMQYNDRGEAYENKPLREYRRERQRAEAEAEAAAAGKTGASDRQPSGGAPGSLAAYGDQIGAGDSSHSRNRTSGGRRFNSRSTRPARSVEPDEEPPIIDTIRDAATRKSREKKEFAERYERSRTGASTVEREKKGNTIREVEYFVPKLSGEDSMDVNYGGRKRKSRNRNPMKMWQKASVTAVCLFLAFIMSLGLGVSALLNRMNFVNAAVDRQQSQAGRGGTQVINTSADKEAAEEMAGVDDTAIELPDTPKVFDADIENVLLVGSDRRTKSEDGRSDAMMLLTIDRKHKKLKMVSFLRDMYIKIPGKYGTKLNSAYSVGGVDLLKATLEANLGLTVDKYIIIDFNAFKTVVNKIGKLNGKGGIKITVTSAEAAYMCSNEKYGYFQRYSKGKGTYYMTGAEALNYARMRKIDSDFGRTKRQRKVLNEIITELKDVSTMDLVSIVYACLEYVTTDFTKSELMGLVTLAPEIMDYETKQISLPIKGSYSIQHMSNGHEVLAANLTFNSKELIKFIYDDDMTYEGNEKEVRGIYLPDLKGIANTNVTTKAATTTSTTAAGDGASTTAAAGSTTGAAGSTTTAAASTTTAASSATQSTTAAKAGS